MVNYDENDVDRSSVSARASVATMELEDPTSSGIANNRYVLLKLTQLLE